MFDKKYRVNILRKGNCKKKLRSDYIDPNYFLLILRALTTENRLAVLVSMYTGLRISDVLSLKTNQIRKQRFTVKEQKTGKSKRIRLSDELTEDLLKIAGRVYVFSNRLDEKKTRTRQAVYKDIQRACKLLRVSSSYVVSPHSARKIYAVRVYRDRLDIGKVKNLLNHDSEAVTMIYAMADQLTERGHTERQKLTVTL